MIIGLTGGIASGKSTCTAWFAAQGVPVVDADDIAHQLTRAGGAALAAIAATFDGVVVAGQLNRAALRARIFHDPAERAKLEAILHPAIRKEIAAQLSAHSQGYQILSAPLLFENNLHTLCAKIVVVDVPEAVQMARATQRDGRPAAEIAAVLAAQIPRAERLARADFIVDNARSWRETEAQLATLHAQFLTLAAQK